MAAALKPCPRWLIDDTPQPHRWIVDDDFLLFVFLHIGHSTHALLQALSDALQCPISVIKWDGAGAVYIAGAFFFYAVPCSNSAIVLLSWPDCVASFVGVA